MATETKSPFEKHRPPLNTEGALLTLAITAPTLLAYNLSPASTLFNQLLSLAWWGLVLLVVPFEARRLGRGTGFALVGAALLATAMVLPGLGARSAQAWGGWALLACAGVLLTAGARTDGADRLHHGLALGCLLAGVVGLAIGVIQVFYPHLADGVRIARTGYLGRAVGNVRQPNHLATLFLMAAVGAVWLGVSWRRHWVHGAVLLGALVFGIVLTASRTGLWLGVPLLVLWGLLDRELPKPWRVLLLASPAFAALSWWGLHAWAQSGGGVFGAEARLDQEGAGSPSRIAILRNAWSLLQMHPWTGVGWGEFNRAWTLTPFPDRPVAFFDHTHNLPLQLLVELGWPLGLGVLGLLLFALGQALHKACQATGLVATNRRAAVMLVLALGLHSLLEYPLWYAYFLLPTALALGIALAPEEPCAARPVRWTRWLGGLLIVGSGLAFWEYRAVAAIYSPSHTDQPLAERIERGQRSWLFSRHADYAAATAMGANAPALAAAQRTGHQLIDARLLIAWAKSLHAVGETDKARYLVARLREFRSREGAEWLKACEQEPSQWMCAPPQGRYTWRDF